MGKKKAREKRKTQKAPSIHAEEVAPPPPPVVERTVAPEPREHRKHGWLALLPLVVGGVLAFRAGEPWMIWLLAIGLSGSIATYLALVWRGARRRSVSDDEPIDRTQVLTAYALAVVPFCLGILVSLEFVKDDAYISFRYAHNLVTGKGLVFNTGERVEGFTNFLWVLVLAPFEALGWDLFQVCEVLGTALGITCIVVTARMTEWIHDRRPLFAQLWGALWLATSSSFALWCKSGLEQPLASLLPIAAAFLLWRASEAETRRHLYAGLVMGAGCMTRPELHLLAVLVGIPLVVKAIRRRKIARADWLYVAGILAVTVPCHLFRYSYYGSLIPNTFYVKTSSGDVLQAGFQTLHDMFTFNRLGVLVVIAPFAFASRKRLVEKATMATIALAFMAYYVRVGVDEMQWHRLYLPALPFLCVLAALGAQNIVDVIVDRIGQRREGVAHFGVWLGLTVLGAKNFMFTYDEMHGFDGHGDLAGTFHPDMGKFLVRHERPGGLVAFQDVGSTPYHAPDIDFLDFIGLVDKRVAHARHRHGLHAFVHHGGALAEYDREMRSYFFERDPQWAILTIYGSGDEKQLAEAFEKDPTGAAFGDAYRNNSFQFGVWDDPRFRDRYVPVRTWPRGSGYYLALWRRRDLWNQTPGEVVLPTPPAQSGGVQAKLEGGLELLGSELTTSTIERHEVLITTWWKLPGPMPRDVYFFIHVNRGNIQVPGDHIPGDWMYPADRWKEGEILEDRVLFQLPPFLMRPGEWSVSMGAYRRSTGERIKILESSVHAEDGRIRLGTFTARKLYPLIDQLIPPTRVEQMRKYPDRIPFAH